MQAIMNNTKMKVEVWSDIMCPFCYIGKRNYEKALMQFSDNNEIELVWKSFQLDPSISKDTHNLTVSEYLVQRKGISHQQIVQMHKQVTATAANAGLEYHLDNTILANSFNAHRLIQLAKEKGLGDEAEEQLFHANFTDGKDFGNTAVLTDLGHQIGLTETEVNEALNNEHYAGEVKKDIQEARELGVTGVPFFVFNRKYAVSGAQPPQTFLQVLEKSHTEWKENNNRPRLEVSEGPSCTPDGNCN
jgi:protein disulfide-isomerase